VRPSWSEYFMSIAAMVAQRSTCLRRKVGAVIVKDKRILTTGYNGAPVKMKHCQDVGCIRLKDSLPSGERHELCRGLHAEQNAIIQAAYHGIAINSAILYCTNKPCVICAKMIINAGLIKVYYRDDYSDPLADQIFAETTMELERLIL